MSKIKKHQILFNRLSKQASDVASSPIAFLTGLSIVIGWALSGHYFRWSEGHSLFINTVTTIATFLLSFLLSSSQKRDAIAVQLKLNELLRATKEARNEIIAVELAEDKDDKELTQEFINIRKETEGQ